MSRLNSLLIRLPVPASFPIFRQNNTYHNTYHTFNNYTHYHKLFSVKSNTILVATTNNNIFSSLRSYSAEAGLTRSNIEARIIDILKSFDKVDPTKVRSFIQDF